MPRAKAWADQKDKNPLVPNANARHFLLKDKQRDLIAAAGGIERAASVCSYGKSTVGRWANADSPEMMPLDALFALEEEAGRHDMSEAIAAARGRHFAGADVAPANGCVMSSYAEAVVKMGDLMSTVAVTFSDARLTPSEGEQIDRAVANLERGLAELRKAVAQARGAGGLDLVKGGRA